MKKFSKLLVLLLVVVLVTSMSILLTACNPDEQQPAPTPTEIKNPGDFIKNADGTVTFMDWNNKVHNSMPSGKNKIINLWPANTSTFFGIGAGGKLLATSIQTAPWVEFFYPEIDDRGEDFVIKGGTSVTAEALIAYQPDLVIVHPSNGAALQEQLIAASIDSIYLNFKDFAGMQAVYKVLGALLGGEYETKLNLWCDKVDETKAKIKAKTDLLSDAERPVVLYCTGIGPKKNDATVTEFSSMGANSIFQDWCEIAGGKYYLAEYASGLGGASSINREFVLQNWPDIILCAGAKQNQTYDTLMTNDTYADKLGSTKIVRNPYVLFDIARFGFEALLQLSQAVSVIQPSIAAELGINMNAEIKNFYKTFSGKTLTDAQVQLIIDGRKPNGQPF